jgi:endonuclease/exonuclease/phosphatase family metal-dependent hydrolase
MAGAVVLAPPFSAADNIIRVATFNASLNRAASGELLRDLESGTNAQARAVAAIVQRVRPDILLVNEFDYEPSGRAVEAFRTRYLNVPQTGSAALELTHTFAAPVNTGVPTGFDLNRDGKVAGPEDAFGFGEFPGQYGMVIYSRFPIARSQARTFQRFLWRDMPGALLPDDPATAAANDWYTTEQLAALRLSSKSHWDVPVRVGGLRLHILASHPTPPGFDGPEDRNGTRNHDEIRFWNDYLTPGSVAYVYDDRGRRGGFAGEHFVIVGDLNSDPVDGDSRHTTIRELLAHPRVSRGPAPESAGATEATRLQRGANDSHVGEPRFDTADFDDNTVGNLRVDYVLPSRTLRTCASGVFWPERAAAEAQLTGRGRSQTSDHRLVWVNVSLDGKCTGQRAAPLE